MSFGGGFGGVGGAGGGGGGAFNDTLVYAGAVNGLGYHDYTLPEDQFYDEFLVSVQVAGISSNRDVAFRFLKEGDVASDMYSYHYQQQFASPNAAVLNTSFQSHNTFDAVLAAFISGSNVSQHNIQLRITGLLTVDGSSNVAGRFNGSDRGGMFAVHSYSQRANGNNFIYKQAYMWPRESEGSNIVIKKLRMYCGFTTAAESDSLDGFVSIVGRRYEA